MAKLPTYEEMGKKIAEEALDGYIYKGKTLREWVAIIAQTNKQGQKDILEQKEKTAAWVPIDEEPHEVYECNACGWLLYNEDRTDFKYCPNCGARMVETQESKEDEEWEN